MLSSVAPIAAAVTRMVAADTLKDVLEAVLLAAAAVTFKVCI